MNRLADATSPYLLQHADNPVDWYPWGEEAFTRARELDRPLLVSVGYSACHWCHVMEHESFTDAATAAVMNELFVNVKVDREERPDVDALTMDACVTMTGHGGWPTTVFLTPERQPFYAGTYFPPEPRHGMPVLRPASAGHRGCLAGAQRATSSSRRRDSSRRSASVAVRGEADTVLDASTLERAERAIARTSSRRSAASARRRSSRPSSALELLLRRGVARGAGDGHPHARRDGARGDVRRRRRRLPSLLGRRALARAALREDAVRQRAARLHVPPRGGRDGRGTIRRRRDAHARLRGA